MGFVANLYAFQQCKNFENQLTFDKVTESLKVGKFLRHSVDVLRRQTVRRYTFAGKVRFVVRDFDL